MVKYIIYVIPSLIIIHRVYLEHFNLPFDIEFLEYKGKIETNQGKNRHCPVNPNLEMDAVIEEALCFPYKERFPHPTPNTGIMLVEDYF